MNGLLIGRFQPFHLGHLEALRFALSKADMLWLGLGSSNRPAGRDNPFSAGQRERMILASVDERMGRRISIYHIPDLDNHLRWIEMIDTIVPGFDVVFTNDDLTRRLYSRRGVPVLAVPFLDRGALSGTNVRGLIAAGREWGGLVPEGTREFLLTDPDARESMEKISNYK